MRKGITQRSLEGRTPDWKRFDRIKKRELKTNPALFKALLDKYESEPDIMSRNRPSKAFQTAQIAPDRVSKRGVGVREGGAK